MPTHRANRVTFIHRGKLNAPPERVFPELCPECEHQWLEGWSSQLVYSSTGHAEPGCVFTTDYEGRVTWVVSRFEPAERIEFTKFAAGRFVVQLAISLEQGDSGGTAITWERAYTTLSRAGDEHVAALSQESFDARMSQVDRRLDHYLEHGTMLREGDERTARPTAAAPG